MPNYRRVRVPGGTYFFTLVVHQRYPLFKSKLARQLLHESIQTVQADRPYRAFSTCLLPDHLHSVWILPRGDCDYSIRWRRIKEEFTRQWLLKGDWEGELSTSRKKKGERGIWQRRFWEHTIEDDEDLERCVNYTHWNPRKHALVSRLQDYEWSTFHRFVREGEYEAEWGGTDPCDGWSAPDEWGE